MNISILYATLTGYSESVAMDLSGILKDMGWEVTMTDVTQLAKPHAPLEGNIIFGCSTYGDGDLNDIAEEFIESLRSAKLDLSHANMAIFALGESIYPDFCGAGQLAKEAFESLNAQVIEPIMSIDTLELDQEKKKQDLLSWATHITTAFDV
ncbi:hypothetical protein COV05_00140 [Candidatus Uhrbacteria bacterium CG10_big_fil_rev_8_21_14_0_10_48_16]|uniref:Flavodoxin-like domain-containing protein n=1 Tax=Candidatus Uhrbacteria bacterium CG10_big_fil_rev_8_21_14_0_10_48_16 TaxID=1975038 RepID=A0A2M8LIH5_9BACT|nr:MAG: hypothetical protein COV05_00140 [Candidatus Uhrbacteria bacterium CG10_big_fil_rev_8_21_14_0_10_48_16]